MRPVYLLSVLIVCAALVQTERLFAVDEQALNELRRDCFGFVEKALAKGPVKDVLWSRKGEKMSFDGIDTSKEILKCNVGGMGLDLKWRNIESEQLFNLVRTAAGGEDNFDPDGYLLAALLMAAGGNEPVARSVMDKTIQKDSTAAERYDARVKKLGIVKHVSPPKAVGVATPVSTDAPAAVADGAPPAAVIPPSNVGNSAPPAGPSSQRRAIAKEHPRIFGNRARLQSLAMERPVAYKGMVDVARNQDIADFMKLPAMALVCAIENDVELGKLAVKKAMKYVNGPIKVGHVTFGHDLAWCAMVYDLCHSSWTPEERTKFHEYMNKTCDANVKNENSVFHNAYYGYKNWGIGLACYATMYENPRAAEHLSVLDRDYRTRAVPAMEITGEGGGWTEGHYIHYWNYEWLVFCEVARLCEGVDYIALAPKFFGRRAICSMFQMLPGEKPNEVNRAIPNGDGGYGTYGGTSEKILAARRILVNYYRNDPAHQAVHSYNQIVPHLCIPEYAYMDFLWNDLSVPKGDLKNFKLSHYTAGPMQVYARSSWEPDATYFFFNCGRRLGAHQHMDMGHFLIAKRNILAGDGGVYDGFATDHCVNYYMRTIAHNCMLIHDPAEKFPDGMRAGPSNHNDGGQAYPWIGTDLGHNAGADHPDDFAKNKKLIEITDLLAYDDHRSFLYTAGDITRAYSANKLDFWTRQIVFIRPSTFVIFDRVQTKNPNFKKTFLLQAVKNPTGKAPNLTITNGDNKLHVQTLLPVDAQVKLNSGKALWTYDGKAHPPKGMPNDDQADIPECRVEISPKNPSQADYFLHVMSTADTAPAATVKNGSEITVTVGGNTIKFLQGSVGGSVEIGGQKTQLTNKIGQ